MQFRAAVIQLNSQLNRDQNIKHATEAIHHAADDGAQLVVLPELFNGLAHLSQVVRQAEPLSGPTLQAMSDLARDRRIYLCAGSICEQVPDDSRCFNTSLLFDPSGQQIAVYRKIHLFDIELDDVTYFESQFMRAGKPCSPVQTSLAPIGQAICYDLRFPELFRDLVGRGAQLLLLPAAFTHKTGEAHWDVLLRARAIENQCFVLAANQCGRHGESLTTYGHSQIIDPWGNVLAAAEATPAVVVADIDLSQLDRQRAQLPCLEHRRFSHAFLS